MNSIEHGHELTAEECDLIRRTWFASEPQEEFDLFVAYCRRTRLNPIARQIYPVPRWDEGKQRWVLKPETSIDGFRLIAERTGRYAGQLGPWWCGKDGKWVDVWTAAEPPHAAKVGVLRSDFKEPLYSVARFAGYMQTTKSGGSDKAPRLTKMWAKMGDLMIAKVAEALALRRAFPHELSGLYTAEEMAQADHQEEPTNQPTGTPKPAAADEKPTEGTKQPPTNKPDPKQPEDPRAKLEQWFTSAKVTFDALPKQGEKNRKAQLFTWIDTALSRLNSEDASKRWTKETAGWWVGKCMDSFGMPDYLDAEDLRAAHAHAAEVLSKIDKMETKG